MNYCNWVIACKMLSLINIKVTCNYQEKYQVELLMNINDYFFKILLINFRKIIFFDCVNFRFSEIFPIYLEIHKIWV
jgi:hypothetical protein